MEGELLPQHVRGQSRPPGGWQGAGRPGGGRTGRARVRGNHEVCYTYS